VGEECEGELLVISAYRHFGLNAPPFEGRPDPRFFYRAPSHAEALATLQFAVQAGKACTVVLGESGSGKTLLGRMLVQCIGPRTGVLWIHGIGQPAGDTQATVCLPGSLADAPGFGTQRIEEASLAGWIRTHLPRSPATVLMVDNADGLREHSWNDLLAVVTREIRTPKPVSVVLLGLPSLINTLAQPGLVRLRRRIFRTCHLSRLAARDVGRYIRHRVAAAGSQADTPIFNDDAVELVHRLSGGNPALINQICDNAMVDAFGDERTRVDAAHIVATVQSITGGSSACPALPGPRIVPAAAAKPGYTPEERFVPAASTPVRHTQPPPDTPVEMEIKPPPTADESPAPAESRDAPVESTTSVHAPATSPAVDVISTATATASDIGQRPLDVRLQALESRLTDALARVRVARTQPEVTTAPAASGVEIDAPTQGDPPLPPGEHEST
jgi:type II secretory pathway predicted ATPase ExeA